MNSSEKGKNFEDYVAFIYQGLLSLENENSILVQDFVLKKNGVDHQIDIYYEFTKARVLHRVAIECKAHSRPVSQDIVAGFASVVNHMKDLSGLMVSKSGFTDGAKRFAEQMGIKLMTPEDLPDFMNIIGLKLQNVYMPHPDEPAEPFYALMEVDQEGTWNGNYLIEFMQSEKKILPLFISRKHAEEYIQLRKEENLAARPLKRGHILFLIEMSSQGISGLGKFDFSIIPFPFNGSNNCFGVQMAAADLKEQYF